MEECRTEEINVFLWPLGVLEDSLLALFKTGLNEIL